MTWPIVVFRIDGVRYGLRLEQVEELVRMVETVPLPGAPAIIEGAVDVRGSVVPVLDVRARFGHPPRPAQVDDRLIVARAGRRRVALRVDAVVGIERVAPSTDALANLGAPASVRLAGVAALPDGLVLIHDLAGFLAEAEARGLDEVLGA